MNSLQVSQASTCNKQYLLKGKAYTGKTKSRSDRFLRIKDNILLSFLVLTLLSIAPLSSFSYWSKNYTLLKDSILNRNSHASLFSYLLFFFFFCLCITLMIYPTCILTLPLQNSIPSLIKPHYLRFHLELLFPRSKILNYNKWKHIYGIHSNAIFLYLLCNLSFAQNTHKRNQITGEEPKT